MTSNRSRVGPVLTQEDGLKVREALLREQRRGGQSFLVVPRISDLQAMQTELAELVPGLQVVPVHGRMRPKAQDAAMVGFGGGNGDVLLATDIIEAGLDIPRANLMIVWGAGRFGLAQLHEFEEEFHDRFGPPGPALDALLLQARLRLLLRAAGVASADLGPEAAALTPVDPTNPAAFAALAARVGGTVRGARVVLPWHERDPAAQAGRLLEMLG